MRNISLLCFFFFALLSLSDGYIRSTIHNKINRRILRTDTHAVAATKDFPKAVGNNLFSKLKNTPPMVKLASILPPTVKSFIDAIYPGQLIFLLTFQTIYRRLFRVLHQWQSYLWKALSFGSPYEWDKSICKFLEDRCVSLSKLISFNYGMTLVFVGLAQLGVNVKKDFLVLLSRILYTSYFTHFIDKFKSEFLPTFLPKLAENRRNRYMADQFSSVVIYAMGILAVCEMISTYLKVPLSSTLAFGGVGGLALGLAARDFFANFLGGMLLLFNEPFTPGDYVVFPSSGGEILGRVERVGWSQTRIRGLDTRPTYMPNSHFAQTAVTNLERITHRKYDARIPIRYQDSEVMPKLIEKIKEKLRKLPKLDVLSMPFRVNFIRIGPHCLEIEVMCYFMTKNLDEFFGLQQAANLDIIAAIKECGAALAPPTGRLQMDNIPLAIPGMVPAETLNNVVKNPPVKKAGGKKDSFINPVVEEEKDIEFDDITSSKFKSVLDDFYKVTKPEELDATEQLIDEDRINESKDLLTVNTLNNVVKDYTDVSLFKVLQKPGSENNGNSEIPEIEKKLIDTKVPKNEKKPENVKDNLNKKPAENTLKPGKDNNFASTYSIWNDENSEENRKKVNNPKQGKDNKLGRDEEASS